MELEFVSLFENNRKWYAFPQCVDFVGILKSHFLKNKIFKYFLHLWFFPGEIYQVIKGKLPYQLKSFCFCHNQLVFQGFSRIHETGLKSLKQGIWFWQFFYQRILSCGIIFFRYNFLSVRKLFCVKSWQILNCLDLKSSVFDHFWIIIS